MFLVHKTWRLALACLLVQCGIGASWAQPKYPSKPVRIVVALGPGTSADVLARFLAESLRRDLQTEVLVDKQVDRDRSRR
jgi:tripartite-type tricarboxylate transporter receptor subunit TctC